MASEHFDVLIVGAGLSGIGAAYHLRRDCPDRSYAILEGRDAIAEIADPRFRSNDLGTGLYRVGVGVHVSRI